MKLIWQTLLLSNFFFLKFETFKKKCYKKNKTIDIAILLTAVILVAFPSINELECDFYKLSNAVWSELKIYSANSKSLLKFFLTSSNYKFCQEN